METLVDKDAVEGNLRLMANCFGVVHGGVGVLLVYATSLFSERCGSMGNGFFFAMTLPGSLLLAVPLLSLLGRKGCLLYSFCSYVVYAILFCVARAMQHGDQEHERCDQAGPVLLCIGSSLAGLAAGVMWTGQGSYFAYAAKLLSTGSDDEAHRQQATSWLAGVFAVRYLGWELSLKLFVSLVQYFGQVNLSIIALIAMATLATVVFAACDNLPKEVQKDPPGQMLGKLRSALALWPDATIWLLSPTNLAFGFGSAYMNGYFNSEIAAKIVGVDTIGALASVTVVTAAMASMGYSFLAKRGKALPLALGSLAGTHRHSNFRWMKGSSMKSQPCGQTRILLLAFGWKPGRDEHVGMARQSATHVKDEPNRTQQVLLFQAFAAESCAEGAHESWDSKYGKRVRASAETVAVPLVVPSAV
ncbi:unnamed protein product [Effrenium voratum]|uniref:Uncharacterized protein n=1 Tax=Effrenium voratum TaxID=2562239 RepID=A0AA36JDZ1_9DINO|nr:unnamed protein product [Effrenium voratum]